MHLKFLFLCLGLLFTISATQAQEINVAKEFEEANRLMEEQLWNVALPIWRKLAIAEPDNANFQYKIGVCYFNQSTKRNLAMPHFEKAVANTTNNYNPYAFNENSAPIESHYYYGRVLHLNYRITEAQDQLKLFDDQAGNKHFLKEDAARQQEKCANALILMGKPVNVEMYNLGEKVNGEYPDYSPVISLDESAIFYTSRRLRADSTNMIFKSPEDGMYFEDIYVSYKDDEGDWQEPELLNVNLANRHLATVNIQPDGQTLFIYRDDEGDGNLYETTLKDSAWSFPAEIADDINSKSYETHVTISPDGNTLFFTSDRKGGLGGKDIYRCIMLPNGEWSMAKNVGAPINTPYDEEGPFFHSDGKTLYFASTGHMGMGGYDIFSSTLNSQSGEWSAPENIGYPINTPDNDVFYVVTPDNRRAYYSSASILGGMGEKDIYMIERLDAVPTPLTLLKGYIVTTDGSKVPSSTIITVTDKETGETVGDALPQPRNGSFVFILPPGKTYNIEYSANDKIFYEEEIFVEEGSAYQEINKEILLNTVGIEDGKDIVVVSAGKRKRKAWYFNYATLPGDPPKNLMVDYLANDGAVLFSEKVRKDGTFKYRELAPGQPNIFRLNADDPTLCGTLNKVHLLSDKADFESVEKTLVSDKKDPCRFLKKKLEPVNFERYFTYNKAKLTKQDDDFVYFMEKLMEILNERGNVTIAFESSASQVPTTTFKTNEALTRARADKAKKMVLESVSERGGDPSKLHVANYTTLVQGPEYKNDFDTNREVYEQFQYIKIVAR